MYKPDYIRATTSQNTCMNCGAIILWTISIKRIHDEWHEKMDKLFEKMAAEEEREQLRDETDRCTCGMDEYGACPIHTDISCCCYTIAGDEPSCPIHGY